MVLVGFSAFFCRLYSALVYGNSDKAIEKPILCLLSCIAYQTHTHTCKNIRVRKKTHTNIHKNIVWQKVRQWQLKRTVWKSGRKEKMKQIELPIFVHLQCAQYWLHWPLTDSITSNISTSTNSKPCTKMWKNQPLWCFFSFVFSLNNWYVQVKYIEIQHWRYAESRMYKLLRLDISRRLNSKHASTKQSVS